MIRRQSHGATTVNPQVCFDCRRNRMNRTELQGLARLRLAEANELLTALHPAGAYYLAGYSVECALKACIAKGNRRHDFPDRKLVNDSYTHDSSRLVRLAGLQVDVDREAAADPAFAVNWTVAKDWSEESRCTLPTATQARDLYDAIAGRRHGVLRWIKRHW